MRYDLHLHTCLSPCADRDMTPATVAGLAKLAGAELIAITDHNSALNLPAAEKACREYGLHLLPGLDCGACGAPSCEALAEDVVRGTGQVTDCVLLRCRQLEARLKARERKGGAGE